MLLIVFSGTERKIDSLQSRFNYLNQQSYIFKQRLSNTLRRGFLKLPKFKCTVFESFSCCIMVSTRADRRLMFFIAIAIFAACLVAIAALVSAAIMVSMVRSANTPTASNFDTNVQGKKLKTFTCEQFM